MDPVTVNVPAKFEVRITLPDPGIPVLQKFGQSPDPPTLLFLPNFNGLLFAWTLTL